MQTIMNSTAGLSLVLNLNWDRILYLGALAVALAAGTWLGTLATQ